MWKSAEIPKALQGHGRSLGRSERSTSCHVPSRSWRDICVRARGGKRPNFRKDESADPAVEDVPRISLDWYFMSDRETSKRGQTQSSSCLMSNRGKILS